MITQAFSQSVPMKISALSDNHVLVSLTPEQRYLLLPIEEDEAQAALKVIVDNEVVETLNVKLAADHIDYSVPLDLGRYTNKPVLLDVTFHNERRSTGDVKDFTAWKAMQSVAHFDTTNREKYRPLYHHTPLWGWMNDPNGMFYKDGVWHLYFQYNPYGSQWENMTWGHSTSQDTCIGPL